MISHHDSERLPRAGHAGMHDAAMADETYENPCETGCNCWCGNHECGCGCRGLTQADIDEDARKLAANTNSGVEDAELEAAALKLDFIRGIRPTGGWGANS